MSRNTEYLFTKAIQDRLQGFKADLKVQGYGASTIRQKSNYAGYFLKWLETEHLQPESTRYNDLLCFIDSCRLKGKSSQHTNSLLRGVRAYYEYLKIQNPGIANPAANLKLKGTHQKVIGGTVDFTELESLYQSFETVTNRDRRNKTILGLLIYQGVTTEELHQLEPAHLRLKEGKIYIPGNRRRNSRTLELKPFQILELHEYLTEVRPRILDEVTAPRPARKPAKINEEQLESQLFISISGSESIKNSLLHLFRTVRKLNPSITSAKQIRQSAITYWLKTMNLRQVQYMAGHKYVSSTERYQQNNLDNLQSKLEQFHPLNSLR
jgi:Site-specific recombinase XerD